MTTRIVLVGLLLAHVLWAGSLFVGTLVLRMIRPHDQQDNRTAVALDFVLASALGLSSIMLLLFVLGSIGLLNPYAAVLAWMALVAGLVITLRSRGDSLRAMLAAPAQLLKGLREPPYIAIYAIALAESVPASLPAAAWDSTMYHLANAVTWAHSGHLVADPYLRSPYNAYNFELLYSMVYAMHLDRFVFFVDWLAFVLAAIGIQALTAWFAGRFIFRAADSLYARLVGLAAALSFMISPLVLSYAFNGYVDVATGFFFLAATTAFILASETFRPYGFIAAALAGTFLGMKIQLALFFPLMLLALGLCALLTRSSRRTIVLALATFAVFAAPWYARNLVSTGDPLSPVFNILLGRTDPIYDKVDYEGIKWNLAYGAQSILNAPLDFATSRTPAFFLSDPGTSTSIALVAAIPLIAIALFVFRKRWAVPVPLLLLDGMAGYAILAIMMVSIKIGRYSLAYFPTLTALLACLIAWVVYRFVARSDRRPAWVAVISIVVVALLGIPEPRDAVAYQTYVTDYASARLGTRYPDRYLLTAGEGDVEARDLSNLTVSSGVPGNALDVRYENAAYYFRASGLTSVGDWFGPGRYSDLDAAIHHKTLRRYFKQFNINSVLIGPRNPGWDPNDMRSLIRAIRDMGFEEVTLKGDPVREFLRPDVAARVNTTLLSAVPRSHSS